MSQARHQHDRYIKEIFASFLLDVGVLLLLVCDSKYEGKCPPETSVVFQRTTLHYIPKIGILTKTFVKNTG
jgi:hypothetical protein